MKRDIVLCACIALIVLAGCADGNKPEPAVTSAEPEAMSEEEMIARGEYLTLIGGCNDCHTPWMFSEDLGMPVPDMSRMLSGHPEDAPGPGGTIGKTDIVLIGPTFTSHVQPFGTVYSYNLTPDVETGLGTWTREMFVKMARTGRHMGGEGRPVMPPMPWLSLNAATDEDLDAIWAYLQSIPPIRNAVPSPEVPEEVMWALRDSFDKMLSGPPPGN